MGSGATKREILEKKLEKRLQDPKTEPLISLPLDFLEDITCGFSTERVLGEGAYGVVYKV
jgi:coatomer subunit beta'